MVAAICYAWLLENRARKEEDEEESVILPVMNVKRGRMWKLRQASWLFHHTGLDVASLVFSDEVILRLSLFYFLVLQFRNVLMLFLLKFVNTSPNIVVNIGSLYSDKEKDTSFVK